MKSALAKRLILTAGTCIAALFLFFGVNIGFQLPADSIVFFAAAAAMAAVLVLYLRYAGQPSPEPAESRAAAAVQPATGNSPESRDKSEKHAS